jgi:hypothetical protein
MARSETPAERLARLATEPGATKVKQMKFRLPGYLYNQIEEAGERNGWGSSQEIRGRLDASFTEEIQAGDDETYRLLHAIKTLARNVEDPFGIWHENRFAFDVFRAAVLALLDLHRPAGEPVRPSDNEIADMFLGEDGTPETAGRMLAGGAATAAGIPFTRQRLRQERR